MREGKVDAVHVTISYHETFRETVLNFEKWNLWFDIYSNLIIKGSTAADIDLAKKTNRTAIFFGFQNPSPIEDDIGLIQILHTLGARFMQLTYNNQSLLATGCYEDNDAGITRMGKQVIKEMNRVGMVVDMSHSADQSTIQAAEISERPIAITHANPYSWHPALRNKRDKVIEAVVSNGGMIGFSLYPHHLKNGTNCKLDSFCEMTAQTVDIMGINNVGIGSDLCLYQPDTVVEWMRNGTWAKQKNFGEGNKSKPGFPEQPDWFRDARGFKNLEKGFKKVGFSEEEINKILGNNWFNFYKGIN